MDIDKLTESFQNLNIEDRRTNTDQQLDESILINMFNQMHISTSNELDAVINNISKLSIRDDDITIELNDKTILVFNITSCYIEYAKMNNYSMPKWQESF